eukprot:s1_g659.t1
MERLSAYESLLRKWQKSINLVSKSTLDDVWRRHFWDSAQLLALASAEDLKWVDFGSGAGFPGLVLAILAQDRPGFQMNLIESDQRKSVFLREVIRETGARAQVHTSRIEADETISAIGPCDALSARACAPLDRLLGWWSSLHVSDISSSSADPASDVSRSSASSGAPHPRVLVLANQKGGVGKTTTAINLGTALAAVGERVLVVDLDPQGNASTGLGVDRADRTLSTYDVLIGAALIETAIVPTKVPGLDLVPSTMDLLGAELELASVPRRSHRLRDALTRMPPAGRDLEGVPEEMNVRPYSYILIDCPPSLNLLTINAMTAADSILVPLQCEFFALEGLSQLLRTVERVRTSLNPRLDIQGIVLTMFDQRNNLSGQVAQDVRAHLGDKVYKTVIPRNVRISEAPSYGKPALVYDHQCAGSRAYMKLASEVIQRERVLRSQTAA